MSLIAKKINLTPPADIQINQEMVRWLIENFDKIRAVLSNGINGTFISNDVPAKTITVIAGVITSIEE